MKAKRSLLGAALAAALVLAACADPVGPRPTVPDRPSREVAPLTAATVFARYVAIGTSVSEGTEGAGNSAATERAAWVAQLAARAGASFALPLLQDPGCGPPLRPPLAADVVLLAAFGALGTGGDLAATLATVCAPLQSGVVLPTNDLAISGANVHDALYTTVALAAARDPRIGALYSRVLPWGQTQVSAMRSLQPTFVSVELASNDVLPASTGNVAVMTPYESWQTDFDAVVAAVASTGARGVLVGLPNNAANFPSVRTAREFFNQWPYLLTLGISVSINCYFSSNYLFLPGYVLSLLSRAPTTATCANVPGTVDYVLTPSDMSAINGRMAQINAHIQAKAAERGYAYFAFSVLYDLPRPALNLYNVLFSSTPFGSNFSADGVHPSPQGHAILANAAVQAINARYGLAIP
jgi:lysophospholipase L1-like esterase